MERRKCVKCLRVLLNDKLSWRDQVQSVRRKCFMGLAKLRRLRNVHPHLDYCSVVWQECSKELRQMLERVQNSGTRLILSKAPRTPSEDLRQELGWTTLEKRREVLRMKIMHQCVNRQVPSCIHET